MIAASYLQNSRANRYSLLFALPLLLLYQVFAARAPGGPAGSIRNGADVMLQNLFTWLAGSRGPLLFMFCLMAAGLWLVVRDWRAHTGRLSGAVFALMLAESVGLALIFGVVVGGLTAALLGQPLLLLVPPGQALDRQTVLMLSLGAGLYEELLFRVLLVGALAWTARRAIGLGPVAAGAAATVLGALTFAAFHYVGPYGDRPELYSFVFRTIAGLFFSALYLARGFGITAWTHALYDVFLLLR